MVFLPCPSVSDICPQQMLETEETMYKRYFRKKREMKNHAAKRTGEAKALRCSSGETREKGLLSRRTVKMILQTLCITAPRAVILAFDLHFSE